MIENFEDQYESQYGKGAGASESGYELVNLRCDGYGDTVSPNLGASTDKSSIESQPSQKESILWPMRDKQLNTDIYYASDVNIDSTISGPAIIRFPSTTISIPPDYLAKIDQSKNVVIS